MNAKSITQTRPQLWGEYKSLCDELNVPRTIKWHTSTKIVLANEINKLKGYNTNTNMQCIVYYGNKDDDISRPYENMTDEELFNLVNEKKQNVCKHYRKMCRLYSAIGENTYRFNNVFNEYKSKGIFKIMEEVGLINSQKYKNCLTLLDILHEYVHLQMKQSLNCEDVYDDMYKIYHRKRTKKSQGLVSQKIKDMLHFRIHIRNEFIKMYPDMTEDMFNNPLVINMIDKYFDDGRQSIYDFIEMQPHIVNEYKKYTFCLTQFDKIDTSSKINYVEEIHACFMAYI